MALGSIDGETLNANGSTATTITWPGGYGWWFVEGTWNTATVTLEVTPATGDAWQAAATALTADGLASFGPLPSGVQVRATMSSAGASSDVDVWVHPAPVR